MYGWSPLSVAVVCEPFNCNFSMFDTLVNLEHCSIYFKIIPFGFKGLFHVKEMDFELVATLINMLGIPRTENATKIQ